MLPSQKNKETITILRKLKQQGAPAPTPMDGISPVPEALPPEAAAMEGEAEVVNEEGDNAPNTGMPDIAMESLGNSLAGRMKKKRPMSPGV